MSFKERKAYLLKDIEYAFNHTNNSSKKITLSNYYDTVSNQPVDKIDYQWYYNALESFGFKCTRLEIKKRYIIPEELNYESACCGFLCHNVEEVIEFSRYFLSINCSFRVEGLYIEPEGQLIPLKRSDEGADVYEYIMLEF